MTSTLDTPVDVVEQAAASARPTSATPTQPAKARGERIGQGLVLAMLFAAPALMAVHGACVVDPDIWWHLRTGEWMLAQRAIPRIDAYTSFAAGKPWQAYSWLFELLVTRLYLSMGLAGMVVYTSAMVLAVTVAFHHMIRRLQSDFSLGALLTFAGCFAMSHLYTPRPWLFTVLFFVLELDILMHARRTGKVRELLWLPLIFALWANLHIQFVDGLLVLGLAATESVLAGKLSAARTRLPMGPALAALSGCLLATLLNPYGAGIYRVAYRLAAQPGVMSKIGELQAIPFRDLTDFSILALALGGAAALARWRTPPLFETALFLFAAVVSFRSQRDIWVIVVASAALIAGQLRGNNKARIVLPIRATPLIAGVAALAVALGFAAMDVRNPRLEGDLAKEMPVKAVEFAKAQGYPGPVFNDFTWGGYLIWNLRLPVSIDGRAGLDGDERIDRSVATWSAEPEWSKDPDLAAAGVVIGRPKAPLTQVLRTNPRFTLAYEDKVAAVFVPRVQQRP